MDGTSELFCGVRQSNKVSLWCRPTSTYFDDELIGHTSKVGGVKDIMVFMIFFLSRPATL